MSIRADGVPPQMAGLQDLAEDLVKVAKHLAPGYGLDDIDTMSALGFASTKMAFRMFAGDEKRQLEALRIMNETATHAMADMIAGKDTPHQTRQ